MIEERLKRRLKRTLWLVICVVAVIFIGGGFITSYLYNARQKSENDQLEAEVEEYKNRVMKQIEADFSVLSAMSLLIDGGSISDREALAEVLDEATGTNSFFTMVFYDVNGEGIICTGGREPYIGADLSELSPEGMEVIESSLRGEAALSNLFESTISDGRVFVYSVPVYDDGEVIGALAASDNVEIFSDILEGNTVLGGGGYIHMLGSEGNFLVRSSKMIVQEEIPTIFDGPYISETSEEKIKQAFQAQESIYSSFSYEGKSYPFLLEPVGINGWYFFCVNTGEGVGSVTAAYLMVVQITFVVVILLMLFLIIYGYRIMHNYGEDLVRLAYFDALTGAENMYRFRQRLKGRTLKGSVAVISIRQFMFLDEIFGREKTDALLRLIKDVLSDRLREDEFFCRDTDDRFYIYFDSSDEDVIRERLKGITDSIDAKSEISKKDYKLVFDCGVAVAGDEDTEDADTLMNQLPFALDKAKSLNYAGGSIWFFDTDLHKKEEVENYVESHMHQALRDGEFKLFLQPQKNLSSDRIESAEALVRWKTNAGRMIFPDQFIPLFERNGFAVQLDLYMVEAVCRRISSWQERGIKPIKVSVNQSKLLFFEEDYIDRLKAILEKYDVSPEYITLEILEGLALENVDELNEKIVRLQSEGFEVSLDDFGSGFSSLNTLGRLKINELKLDRDFLLNASNKYKDRIRLIMREVVHMSRQLGIYTVAEGVETAEDEALIKDIGIDIGQGYYYSRPIAADDFDREYMNNI